MNYGKLFVIITLALASVGGLAKDLVVAQVAPFGGPLAASGRDFNLGAMLAFDEINAAGGITGNRIRLISRDDGYRSTDTVKHVTELLEQDNPLALIGMWGAENIDAVIAKKLLENAGLPVVGVRSGVAALRKNANIFHIRASYRDEVQRILEQVQTIGSTRIAVFYEDDGSGREALADVQDILSKRSLKPLVAVMQPKNSLKTDEAATAIATAQPQVVLLLGSTPVVAALVKELKTKNNPALMFATSTVDAEQLIAQLGKVASGVAVAQSVPNPYKATTPVAMDFQNRIKFLGLDPARGNFAALEGYIAARVVAESLRRAGRDPTRKDVVRGLESMKRTDVGGFIVDFSPQQREGSRFVDLALISADGRLRQ